MVQGEEGEVLSRLKVFNSVEVLAPGIEVDDLDGLLNSGESFFKQCHMILILGLCILLRVYQPIYIETSVRNKCRCSFYCALLTLHVSADIGGHLQVVCSTKIFFESVTACVNGSVASVCLTIYVP
jgi:hypothetical protein